MSRQGMWHAWERREMRTGLLCRNFKKGGHLDAAGIHERITAKFILNK
jgi:hypothetical protein